MTALPGLEPVVLLWREQCKRGQRTCGLFDSLDDVGARRKHKAEPLIVESGHCGK